MSDYGGDDYDGGAGDMYVHPAFPSQKPSI